MWTLSLTLMSMCPETHSRCQWLSEPLDRLTTTRWKVESPSLHITRHLAWRHVTEQSSLGWYTHRWLSYHLPPPTPQAGGWQTYRTLFQACPKHAFAGISEPQTGRKYSQCVPLAKDSPFIYPEYIKMSFKLTIKRQLNRKWAKTWISSSKKKIQEWLISTQKEFHIISDQKNAIIKP